MNRQKKFEDYEGFVEKFKPKKTTDDCMTPPKIYEVVKDYACKRFGIDPDKVVRPFFPGGDYEAFDYSGGKVVIDNPPFSILSKICNKYIEEGIPFFLFAPSLTLLNSSKMVDKMNHIICDCRIVYENGAKVLTSFVTSYGLPIILESNPELTRAINEKMDEILKEKTKKLSKYDYPYEIVTAAMVQRYSKYGVRFQVLKDEAIRVRRMDAQREIRKEIYGSGLLLSSERAAERAAAEKAAELKFKLSDRERAIVENISQNASLRRIAEKLAYTE